MCIHYHNKVINNIMVYIQILLLLIIYKTFHVYTLVCKLYTAYKINTVKCTPYSVQCTLYTAQCTVYNIQCKLSDNIHVKLSSCTHKAYYHYCKGFGRLQSCV